jgi:hypothetical protein
LLKSPILKAVYLSLKRAQLALLSVNLPITLLMTNKIKTSQLVKNSLSNTTITGH